MSDTTATIDNTQWPDRDLTDAQSRNRENAALIPVTRSGAIPMNFAQMVDYAKFMSTARGAVGAHLMGNVGACLAVMEIANQFGLPAYAVARQSYLVNGRIAFMGQFFHSIIEDYAPLEKGPNGRKLQFKFKGEGGDLQILVYGTFKGASEPVEYESPMVKDIKVKNSPLWASEPRRQLIYFGVRGWQTINWSEGMMHAISEDEAAALPPSDYARDITPIDVKPGSELRERLAAHNANLPADHQREGFTEGYTEGHFTEVTETGQNSDADASKKDETPHDEDGVVTESDTKDSGETLPPVTERAPRKRKAKATEPAAETKPTPLPTPKTVEQWKIYATSTIEDAKDPKALRSWWQSEQKLRNSLGVTSEDRDPIFEAFQNKLAELEG